MPRDMHEYESWDSKHERGWRELLMMGIALISLLLGSMCVGLFLGYMIWGI